jgi:hypothetical protein
MRDDVIDLATGDGMLDQCPGSCNAKPLTSELGSHFVADLDCALDWRGGEAT